MATGRLGDVDMPRLLLSPFQCRSTDAGLVLSGEVDLATAPLLEDALQELAANTSGDVRLECAPLSFIDSSGLRVLVGLHHQLAGRRIVLTNLPEHLRRVFEIAGLHALFDLE